MVALLLVACGATESGPPARPTPTPAVPSATPAAVLATPTPAAVLASPTRRAARAAATLGASATPAATPRRISEYPTPVPTPVTARPARLRIPRLGIDAAIEHVGLDPAGRMATPARVEDVAWYAPGSEPGAIGNAVLAGHLDTFRQQPAVFWRLDELVPGDRIIVTDLDGTEHRFEVMASESYLYQEAPLGRIFGFSTERRLNLITCRGEWDASSASYDERLVVYTRAID